MEVGDKGSVKTSSRSGVTHQKIEEKGTPLWVTKIKMRNFIIIITHWICKDIAHVIGHTGCHFYKVASQ